MLKNNTFSHELFRLARLRAGRRVTIYNQWRPLMVIHGMTEAIAYLDRALMHDAGTRQLENRWKASTRRRYSESMPRVDSLVDGLLHGIMDLALAQIRGLPAGDPLVQSASILERELFPAGVHAIASLPYLEQATACEVIVAKLQGGLVTHVANLGLGRLVARLADAVVEYRQMVDGDNGNVLYAEVRTAHDRGLDFLVEILSMIVARFHDSDNADHVAVRNGFMAPLAEQDQQAREDHRRSRTATGDNIDEPGSIDDTGDTDGPGGADEMPAIAEGGVWG